MPVNELSNTMDLESTLIKAESLFRRFQRLVEAVDKKQNFPGPKRTSSILAAPAPVANTGQGKTKDTPDTNSGGSSSNRGRQAANRPSSKGNDPKSKTSMPSQEKVITPELRKLLSRTVEVLPRTMVAQKGDGMPANE